MQKLDRAGSDDDVDIANATKSVKLVTVIDVAACARVSRMRFAIGSFRSVWSNAFAITKESSTPRPRITNGKTVCTGVHMNPRRAQKPNAEPMASRIASTEESANSTRDSGCGQSRRHGIFPKFTLR